MRGLLHVLWWAFLLKKLTMYDIVIQRDQAFGKEATLGTCLVYHTDGRLLFKSESLERGWRNNQNNVSCIPAGVYDCVLEHSPRFKKKLWELKGVPGRGECKFHAANYWHQLNGCIALGRNRKYLDGDKVLDVTSSAATMQEFHRVLDGQTKVRVTVHDILNHIRP